MTEALVKFAREATKGVNFVDYGAQVHCLSSKAADFWLRALAHEVMSKVVPYDDNGMLETHIGIEFTKLVRSFWMEEK